MRGPSTPAPTEPERTPAHTKSASIRPRIPLRCATPPAAAKDSRAAPSKPRNGFRVRKACSSLRTSSSKEVTMFTGCGTAMVTPFRRDLSLDEATLRKLVRRQIQDGIDFLVPCGTTGENPTLTRAEHLRVVEITLEEAKNKVPVLAGCGGYNTTEVIDLGNELRAMGADGLLS